MKPTVASVVLNWNRPRDTIACVKSLLASTYPNEVCVVDNGSTGDSLKQFAKQKWMDVTILRNKTNEGYVGNNTGIEWALREKADYVFIVNNDVVVERKAIEKLLEPMLANEKIAIATPLTMYFSRPDVVWSAGATFNPLIYKAGIRGDGTSASDYVGAEELQLAVGAAMLVRAKAIRETGLLDEKYFAYYEETKWQHEMKKTGWRIVLQPVARVFHKIAASTGGGESPLSTYYLVRNRGHFIRDECPLHVKPIAYASLLLEVLARTALNTAKMRPSNIAMAWKGLADFILGKTGRLN